MDIAYLPEKASKAVCLFLKLTLSGIFVVIFQSAVLANDTALLTKAENNNELRIIVRFKESLSEQGSISRDGMGYRRSKSARLSERRQALLANIDSRRRSKARQFEHVPQMALAVSKTELQGLLNNPDIEVIEDVLRKPMLSQSVPKVYSARNFSSYHGNNDWTIAILDSGVDKSHSFLSDKVVSEACYSDGGGQSGTTSLCPGGALSSTAPNSGLNCALSIDGCDHGTHIAGIAAGNGPGFDGVARDAKLISIQIFSRVDDVDFCFPFSSCVGSWSSDLIAALNRVYSLRNTHNIAAVNISTGSGLYTGTCDNQPEKPVIDLLRSVGIATIIASGNDGSNSQMASPACISSAIAVGSTNVSNDDRTSTSNSSVALDFYAPGNAINSSVPGEAYLTKAGTSFAAPHVAGAWAVLKHLLPTASVNEIESLLDNHGPNITVSGVTRRRIDVAAALLASGGGNSVVMAPILMLLLGDD